MMQTETRREFAAAIAVGKERGRVQHLRKFAASLAALGGLSSLAGCGRAPSFNILGSFFPAWLICMIVGIVLAFVVYSLLVRFKLDKSIQWTIVVYPCLAAFFAFTLWLVFFS
jgi:YtcA family